jgi:hypothetical protein
LGCYPLSQSDNMHDFNDIPHICHICVGERYLSELIAQTGKHERCSYCNTYESAWSIEQAASAIEKALGEHYVRTPDQPNSWQQAWLADKESDYTWEREGEPIADVIEQAADIPTQAAEDILEVLAERHSDFEAAMMGDESEFDPASYYERTSAASTQWQREWRLFEESLRTEARFFSRSAAGHLAPVFGEIHKIGTRSGRSLVVQAGPGNSFMHLFRARVFQADAPLEEALCRPDLHLGPPPARLATAGRMSARGISVFYGSPTSETAIAEVRPPVGSRVAVARFAITRTLQLLDLTALEAAVDEGSIFDPWLKSRLERVAFIRTLGQQMTRPVMPDDEAFDYLATQAVADFLATENVPSLDGIIYRSAQVKDGKNVVLFHKSARVKALDLPEGTRIGASCYTDTEDGPEIDYWVSEETTVPQQSGQALTQDLHSLAHYDSDAREPALQVDAGDMQVHWVEWVKVHTTSHNVMRSRFERRSEPIGF